MRVSREVAEVLRGRKLIEAVTFEGYTAYETGTTVVGSFLLPGGMAALVVHSTGRGKNKYLQHYKLSWSSKAFWDALLPFIRLSNLELIRVWVLDHSLVLTVLDFIEKREYVRENVTEGWRRYYQTQFLAEGELGPLFNHRLIDEHKTFEVSAIRQIWRWEACVVQLGPEREILVREL